MPKVVRIMENGIETTDVSDAESNVSLRALQSLQDLHSKVSSVMVSLKSPTLEALSNIQENEQVDELRTALKEIQKRAADLLFENDQLQKAIFSLDGNVARPLQELKKLCFETFMWRNKILFNRLARLSDPNCNKSIQCSMIDQDLCKTSQTLSLDEAIHRYIKEKERLRLRELDSCNVIVARPYNEAGSDGYDQFDDFEARLLHTLKNIGFAVAIFFAVVSAGELGALVLLHYFLPIR